MLCNLNYCKEEDLSFNLMYKFLPILQSEHQKITLSVALLDQVLIHDSYNVDKRFMKHINHA